MEYLIKEGRKPLFYSLPSLLHNNGRGKKDEGSANSLRHEQ
jgi:hypothetical protein